MMFCRFRISLLPLVNFLLRIASQTEAMKAPPSIMPEVSFNPIKLVVKIYNYIENGYLWRMGHGDLGGPCKILLDDPSEMCLILKHYIDYLCSFCPPVCNCLLILFKLTHRPSVIFRKLSICELYLNITTVNGDKLPIDKPEVYFVYSKDSLS